MDGLHVIYALQDQHCPISVGMVAGVERLIPDQTWFGSIPQDRRAQLASQLSEHKPEIVHLLKTRGYAAILEDRLTKGLNILWQRERRGEMDARYHSMLAFWQSLLIDYTTLIDQRERTVA